MFWTSFMPNRFLMRKIRIMPALALAAVTLTVLCGPDGVMGQPAFPLHTAGRFIVDSTGARVHLSGVNWYGAESSDFVVAGLQAATLQSIVQQIKSLGFNVVRLPWSNQLFETNPVVGNYALAANPSLEGENALTILDQVIAALTNAGIMVILDNHNSNAEWCCSTSDGNSLWYNSQYPQANWQADWQGMAQRYASNPLVIGADLRNEPRSPATWGGSTANDWHAAAELGGNAVLSVNPHLLVFVEGVNYATDLSGVSSLPIQLNVPNQLVYEAHNYGFDYSGLSGYSDYLSRITSKWGYLATGKNPQPLWVGEFGTCNTKDSCVNSGSNADLGFWFNMITAYFQQNGIDWTYWAVNGTHSTGGSSPYGATETYGVLNSSWNGTSNAALTARLESMMTGAPADFTLVGSGSVFTVAQGSQVAPQITIVPGNGFSGTVNLTCSVSGGPGGATIPPTCSVPATVGVTGTAVATVTMTISTAGSTAANGRRRGGEQKGIPGAGGDAVLACVLLLAGGITRRRKNLTLMLVLFAGFCCIAVASACGGGGGMSNPGTTAGAYTVTVTGAATGTSSATVQIAVTVQ
jgi:endoglucanase